MGLRLWVWLFGLEAFGIEFRFLGLLLSYLGPVCLGFVLRLLGVPGCSGITHHVKNPQTDRLALAPQKPRASGLQGLSRFPRKPKPTKLNPRF